jgi:hypothetical protein
MEVAQLHRLAGRYDNFMPNWFLALIAGIKLPTQTNSKSRKETPRRRLNGYVVFK